VNGVVFKLSELYSKTLIDKARAKPIIGQKMQEFRKFKSENPLQSFGSKDYPFIANGHYGTAVPGLRHAHLTDDLSIVYTISGRDPIVFKLYGIFSHSELGTGQPANMKRQKSLAKRMAGQEFSD
jgi:mRNA-degrading endonuclease YafQ of YafQ-DinJ toxin-antitoxin module